MVWIQWAIIAHGGYLAGQPEIKKRLAALHRVIEARAQGLQPLLQLKGKLDMLAAQFDLRRDEQERNAREEEDEEDAVAIYVEGESDLEDSEEDELDEEQKLMLNGLQDDEDLSSDGEGAPVGAFANGVVRGDVSDSSDEEDGFIDDEASESDGEEDSDEEEDEEEDDDQE
jgi:U3 small nucleolar RNA-associated protein 5